MKKLLFILSASLLMTACNKDKCCKGKDSKTCSSETKDSEWKPVDSATATKAWMEFATPGDMHKLLAKYDGEWTGETSMWMEEGAKPIKSSAECINKMIFDGRYQLSNYKGNFMGMPFEGMGIMGYDNAKKKFVSSWVDNMGTGIMSEEGDWNASKKSIEFKGKMTDPARPGKECKVREVYTFVDENTHTLEMYGPDPKTGKEMKTMEIKFMRNK